MARQKSAVVDKWKKKKKFVVLSSPLVGSTQLCETIAEKPEMLMGRTVKANMGTVMNQARKKNIDLTFKVNDVQGTNANTKLVGYELKSSFARRMFRRRSSKIQCVQFLDTKDNHKIKVKSVIVTSRKVENMKQKDARKLLEEHLSKLVRENDVDAIFDYVISKDIFADVSLALKKIVLPKRTEIEAIKLIS